MSVVFYTVHYDTSCYPLLWYLAVLQKCTTLNMASMAAVLWLIDKSSSMKACWFNFVTCKIFFLQWSNLFCLLFQLYWTHLQFALFCIQLNCCFPKAACDINYIQHWEGFLSWSDFSSKNLTTWMFFSPDYIFYQALSTNNPPFCSLNLNLSSWFFYEPSFQ